MAGVIGVPQVLRVPEFRNVWLASMASNAGSWLQVVAAGWLILELTGSPAAVGALALVMRGPALLLSAYAGGLADRFDRRRLGAVTFLAQGAAAGVLAVLSAVGAATPAAIYLLTFVMGIGFALGLPAMLALIPALVAPERLPQAVSLNAAGINVARLAGPAIGGAVLAGLGPGPCFALNAVSFLALVAALAALPASPRQPPRANRAGLRPALAFAMRDPAARRLLLGMALFCTLAAPAQELAPVMAEALGGGPGALGLLLGAMGGGALLGAWGLERLTARGYPRHRALLGGHHRLRPGPRGGGRRAVARPRPGRHGLLRLLLDLDVRGHQHLGAAALAAEPARAHAGPVPALGDRADRPRLGGRRRPRAARGHPLEPGGLRRRAAGVGALEPHPSGVGHRPPGGGGDAGYAARAPRVRALANRAQRGLDEVEGLELAGGVDQVADVREQRARGLPRRPGLGDHELDSLLAGREQPPVAGQVALRARGRAEPGQRPVEGAGELGHRWWLLGVGNLDSKDSCFRNESKFGGSGILRRWTRSSSPSG